MKFEDALVPNEAKWAVQLRLQSLQGHKTVWSSQGSKLDWVVRTWADPMAEQNQMSWCLHPIHWSAKHLDYLSLEILKGEQCHSVVSHSQTWPVNSRLGIKWEDQKGGNFESTDMETRDPVDQVWMVKLVLRQTETIQGVCWLGSQGGQGRNLVGRPKETGQE